MAAIIVHGGCGREKRDPGARQAGMEAAAEAGWQTLGHGGSAVDAVEAAVVVLEDHPTFNAGTGSCLNFDGEVETDASVMTSDGGAGAVAAVHGVKNPVRLARAVLERTDHILLAGAGAEKFARMCGLPMADLVTPERLERWKTLRARLRENTRVPGDQPEFRFWKKLDTLLEKYLAPGEEGRHGTVGAVAIDDAGRMAAATSTGGIWFKLPGRVGDTPIFGAGTYASQWGAASATGHGEGVIRLHLTRTVVDRMERLGVQEAVEQGIAVARDAGIECGVIAVDHRGQIGSAFHSEFMGVAVRQTTRA